MGLPRKRSYKPAFPAKDGGGSGGGAGAKESPPGKKIPVTKKLLTTAHGGSILKILLSLPEKKGEMNRLKPHRGRSIYREREVEGQGKGRTSLRGGKKKASRIWTKSRKGLKQVFFSK